MSSSRSIASMLHLENLGVRLAAIVGRLLLVSAAVLGTTFYRQSSRLLEVEIANRGHALAGSLAFHATYGVITRDPVLLRESAEWTLDQPGVAAVSILDAGGAELVRAGGA